MARAGNASSGHRLGQIVGDWFEEYFVLPVMKEVASALKLYLDTRFARRQARGDKLLWQDDDGNLVDYDFVLELEGTETKLGVPVAFIEGFWRRGARHSKDKARDDSGKLLPMRDVHPTARFLGVVASGDFTSPARELLTSRDIDLFYIPKAKLVAAFSDCGITIDYPDTASERVKGALVAAVAKGLTPKCKQMVAERLRALVGGDEVRGYVDRVRAALRSLPQEFRLVGRRDSPPVVLETLEAVHEFLKRPAFSFEGAAESFVYSCVYSDGTEFERPVPTIEELRALHRAVERLANHMAALAK